jgi:hypothetical protein
MLCGAVGRTTTDMPRGPNSETGAISIRCEQFGFQPGCYIIKKYVFVECNVNEFHTSGSTTVIALRSTLTLKVD